MKNEKENIKKIGKILVVSIIILTFCVFNVQKTFAFKKAVFPDGKSLQPIPTTVKPNISGNINSTTDISQSMQKEIPKLNEKKDISDSQSQKNETKSGKKAIFYIVWSLIALLVIFFLFFIYKKLKQK